MFETILHGKASDELTAIIARYVHEAIDNAAGDSKDLVRLVAGSKRYDAIKNIAVSGVMDDIRIAVSTIYDYTEEALDMENALRSRMAALPPEQFTGFLRPVFQEDELKLILVGAFLGCMAGFAQLYFLF